MDSRETVRFGEGDASGPDGSQDGVAHNSTDLDETLEEGNSCNVKGFGGDEVSKGIGIASLAECLGRMGAQPSSSIPAICATGSGNRRDPPYTNPGRGSIRRATSALNIAQMLSQR